MSEDSNRRPLPVGLDEGAGRPLVLIPGYAMRPDMYRRTARLLAERCRVILIDIYAIRGRWRYEDVLESFTATLDNLGLERASFLGHSFGSGIELGFAVRHPRRVVELVFCDTLAVSSEWALAEEALSRPVRLLGMATPKAAIDFIRSWVTHPRQLVDAACWGFKSGRSRDIHIVAEAGIPAHVLWANRDSLLVAGTARSLRASCTLPFLSATPGVTSTTTGCTDTLSCSSTISIGSASRSSTPARPPLWTPITRCPAPARNWHDRPPAQTLRRGVLVAIGLVAVITLFGVVVRAILRGMSATRIFTKIDRDSVPNVYQASIARFLANNSSTGSDPAVTADVIYRAVIDPDPTAVRYYSAPDSAPGTTPVEIEV